MVKTRNSQFLKEKIRWMKKSSIPKQIAINLNITKFELQQNGYRFVPLLGTWVK
jgi:hypothetical protein